MLAESIIIFRHLKYFENSSGDHLQEIHKSLPKKHQVCVFMMEKHTQYDTVTPRLTLNEYKINCEGDSISAC